LITALGLVSVSYWTQSYVESFGVVTQANYHFPLTIKNIQMQCTLEKGALFFHGGNGAVIRLEHRNPRRRETATVSCNVESTQTKTLKLYVFDAYEGSGYPDRLVQIVYVNENRVLRHDMAGAPWTGWLEIPLETVSPDSKLSFTLELKAINPDYGWEWGTSSLTVFRVETEN
jgi:hypothetical protein